MVVEGDVGVGDVQRRQGAAGAARAVDAGGEHGGERKRESREGGAAPEVEEVRGSGRAGRGRCGCWRRSSGEEEACGERRRGRREKKDKVQGPQNKF